MRAATIRLSDEALLELLSIKDATILGVQRAETFTATDFTIIHPSLPDLTEGCIPTPISLDEIAKKG